MRIIKPGSIYAVANFREGEQIISFTEKVDGQHVDGTTNEEVIDMLIERLHTINQKKFSPENIAMIHLLDACRRIANKRLSRKRSRVKSYEQQQSSS